MLAPALNVRAGVLRDAAVGGVEAFAHDANAGRSAVRPAVQVTGGNAAPDGVRGAPVGCPRDPLRAVVEREVSHAVLLPRGAYLVRMARGQGLPIPPVRRHRVTGARRARRLADSPRAAKLENRRDARHRLHVTCAGFVVAGYGGSAISPHAVAL